MITPVDKEGGSVLYKNCVMRGAESVAAKEVIGRGSTYFGWFYFA